MQINNYIPIEWDSINYTHDWTGDSTYEHVEIIQENTEDYTIAYRNIQALGLFSCFMLLFIFLSINKLNYGNN